MVCVQLVIGRSNSPYYIILHNFNVFVMVFAFMSMAKKLSENKNTLSSLFCKFSNRSFFIYAFHATIALEMSKLFLSFFFTKDNPWCMIIMYLCIPIFAVIVSLVTYEVLNRYYKPLLDVLTGSRNTNR